MDGLDLKADVQATLALNQGAVLPAFDPDATPEELKKTANQFEGLFVSMLLQQFRKSMTETGLFGEGPGADIYAGMFDRAMGEQLAGAGGIGIAEVIIRSAMAEQSGKQFTLEEVTSGEWQELAEKRAQESESESYKQEEPVRPAEGSSHDAIR